MLGKLFNRGSGALAGTTSSSNSASTKHPESVQEDLHTRNLLFPDATALYQHRHDQVFPLSTTAPLPSTSTSNAFDYDADIELDERDVRVLIMQGATPTHQSTALLYDSQAPQSLTPTAADRQAPLQDPRRNPTSPRKSSLSHSRPVSIQQDSPTPRQGLFERRGSIQSRMSSYAESESQRGLREYRDELVTFSSCIFANSEIMSYKGTSTKVHVIPTESRSNEFSTSYFGDGRGSIGRSSARSSRLAQSFTSEIVSPTIPTPSLTTSASTPRLIERRKVLITRLFPVHLPIDDPDTSNPSSRDQHAEDNSGFPFPKSEEESAIKNKSKTKKTPMYAVALVIQLPRAPPSTATRSAFRASSSYTEQESFPSSFSSTRRSGWTMVGAGFGSDSVESTYSTDVEDQIDTITQHWDIIMRTLTNLQSVVASVVAPMLKQYDLAVSDPHPNVGALQAQGGRPPPLPGRRYDEMPQHKVKINTKYIVLPSNSLTKDKKIVFEVEAAKSRIVSGLRATRVVTGQGRWGIWREEARWMARWAGGRDQGFFFFNLLTGFLSTHTDWLQALSPLSYRKRYLQQQKAKMEEDMSLPARTIIVAHDKMAARRLIFLLSAFLPANQQLPGLRAHRPSTAASGGMHSQSPPSCVVPILREESLRRKINRRAGPRQHSRNVSIQSQTARSQGVPAPLAHLAFDGNHERKSSDLSLMRQSSLSVQGSDSSTRKTSVATTATVTPEATIPHFSTAHQHNRVDSRPTLRPSSSGSVAADDLKRSLTRCDNTGQAGMISADSRSQNSRWGNVINSLWSPRRRDSTSGTLHIPTSMSSPMSPVRPSTKGLDRLSEMAKEAETTGSRDVFPSDGRNPQTPRQTEGAALDDQEPGVVERSVRKPDPSGVFQSPVKTSINAIDGVIDVDVPFPDYLTSFETAVSSPSSSGYLSTPGFNSGLEAFEQSFRTGIDSDLSLNVGGWLRAFHPDFTLQAIPSQPDLMDQVKATLRAEPTPSAPLSSGALHPLADRWVDVSTTLIADATNFSILRVRYRRLVRPKALADPAQGTHTTYLTPSIAPYENQLKEEFIEEPIVSLEELLTEAVEKVIAQTTPTLNNPEASTTGGGSKGSPGNGSASSSRSNSKGRERRDSLPVNQVNTNTNLDAEIEDVPLPLSAVTPRLPPVPTEVPRSKCKTVVLSSLEDLVLDVVEQRKREVQAEEGLRTVHVSHERESVLRAAIRDWLDAIDLVET